MNQTQHYCLRWNNHIENLLSIFDEMLQSETLTDVSISCTDGEPIKAHRIILAACSEYFQDLFTHQTAKGLVVILRDVKRAEIKTLLDYMYRGEVNVAQDQLGSLLKLAEDLKVKGLMDGNRTCNRDRVNHSPSITTSSSHIPNEVHSSCGNSPPYPEPNPFYGESPFTLYDKRIQDENIKSNLPLWALRHMAVMPSQSHQRAVAAAILTNAREDLLKKTVLAQQDTPILRTVLGQNHSDLDQPLSLVCQTVIQSNGNNNRSIKNELSPNSNNQRSANEQEDKYKITDSSSPSQSFSQLNYPSQKPRYKLYTKADIMAAINEVRKGMSALQASKLYNVPSRTLYDKVKKMGIKKNSNGGTFGHHPDESSINSTSTSTSAANDYFRDTEETFAAALAAAAAFKPSKSPNVQENDATSPTTTVNINNGSSEAETESDMQVEDLSMKKQVEFIGQARVIMSPINCSAKERKKQEETTTFQETMRIEGEMN